MAAGTDYLVFKLTDTDDVWERCSIFKASTSDAAKQAAALEIGEGTFAAVPARSWSPSAFKVQSVARAVKS